MSLIAPVMEEAVCVTAYDRQPEDSPIALSVMVCLLHVLSASLSACFAIAVEVIPVSGWRGQIQTCQKSV
jgi:hypothetical protein